MDTGHWVREEFNQIEFGDLRLDRRFLKSAEDLARSPTMSINGACLTWTDTKAAYRLFDNPKCSTEAILKPHIENTVARATAFKRFYPYKTLVILI